jgi:hypothetical protein
VEGKDTWANMPIIKKRLKELGLEHDNIEEVYRIPLFEGSTLLSLCATFLILNCCHIHGASNAFITKVLGLVKKTYYLPQIHCNFQNMRFLAP